MGFDIGQLFNPLSLFGAAQQELQQFQNMLNPTKQADQAGAANSGMNLLNNLGIGDIVTQFTKSYDSQPADAPPDCQTETGPQQSSSAPSTGYAPPKMTDDQKQLLNTMKTIVGEFNEFDAQYGGSMFKDGKFDRDNLTNIVLNHNDFDPPIVNAAQYLLMHPDVFDQLAELSGGDGCITAKAAQQFQDSFVHSLSSQTQPDPATAPPTAPPTGSTDTQPAHHPPVVDRPLHNPYCDPASSSVAASSSGSNSSDIRSTIAKRGQDALDDIDAKISKLMDGPMDPKSLQQLQQLMEKRQEMFTALSNIDKCYHDMSMTAINNMR